ncbi:hypothetical protein [Poseidonocella sp. HB161398]|uniref:hypothetical protein n=1 Tax=Poseidonocella sp. HB161398 TaxID=2320855 RepID=UPI00110955AC|nr:hypothetical protein [Poseidonocella sp. HB161398]
MRRDKTGPVAAEETRDGPNEEAVMLQVARFMFQSFARPEEQAWRHAIDYSTTLDEPSRMLRAISETVQAMRAARVSVFRFANPACPRCARQVTPHERQFMACISCARRGEFDKAERHATLLCEGNGTGMMLAALALFPELPGARAGALH